MRRPGTALIPVGALVGATLAYAAPAAARCRVGRALFPPTTRTGSPDAVALTFDDGPDDLTPKVLDGLDQAGARATFFVLGEQAARRAETVREISARGHEVAVHGYRHRSHLLLSPRQTVEDMRRAQAVIEESSRTSVRSFRPPYGVFNAASWVEADLRGWRRVLWSRCGREWEPDATVASVLVEVGHPVAGDVVMLHDSARYGRGDAGRLTLDALPRVLGSIFSSGLRVRPVGELLVGEWS